MQLVVQADPSEKSISTYLEKSDVYVALENYKIIGVYGLTEIALLQATFSMIGMRYL